MAHDANKQINNGDAANGVRTVPADHLVETKHTAPIGAQTIAYTATAGTIVLREEAESEGDDAGRSEGFKPKATIFMVAYTRDAAEPHTRPLTFVFNGGPGSSSVWLHLGVFGPQRVLMDEHGHAPPPPYRLVPNAHSLLDRTDLVFIDPVTTGYSRAVEGEKAKAFHGFTKDIEAVGDFIRLYTSRYGRWLSPKFVAGESYGTTRAAGLSGYLQERHGMFLNGLMLISSVLDFQTLSFELTNDLPYPLFLPTYTATAWYHKRLDADLQADLRAALNEVEAWSFGPYQRALLQGAALPETERDAIAQQLARYTGLSPQYVQSTDLRIKIDRFVKELLRTERRTVGRLDSRFLGTDRDAAGEEYEYDPSYSNIQGPYTATLNHYVRTNLQFQSDLPYEILTGRVQPWSYAEHENQYVSVSDTLRKAMAINPFLKVFVASGYYDLATPYFATTYTFNHLGLDRSVHSNITQRAYEAGHMMYIHQPSLAQLKDDLQQFIDGAWTEQ